MHSSRMCTTRSLTASCSIPGGVHGRGACMARGHAWQGEGVCVAGGTCVAGGHAWQGAF